MLLDTEATENESNISIVNVLKKDFIVARTEAVRKYNFKTFFSKQKVNLWVYGFEGVITFQASPMEKRPV